MAQMPLLNLIFLGLGLPWVGEFVGFIIIFICFPTQGNLVYRKHTIVVVAVFAAGDDVAGLTGEDSG